jgi:DNA-binding CsgD family transcriptional regulator
MNKSYNYLDLARAFGKQDYVIYQKDYQQELQSHPLAKGLWSAGKWFSIIGNTHSWKTEMILGDCDGVTGYSAKEALQEHAQFVVRMVHPDDMPFVAAVINLGMQYLHNLPENEREYMYVSYFTRALRKDGRMIIVQNQSFPLVFDAQKIPFIFSNIISDISFLQPANIPHALIVNTKRQKLFHINPEQLHLKPYQSLFTEREKELIRHLVKGFTARQIGEEMHISHETVRTHRRNILQKAGLQNTAQLIRHVLLHDAL